MLLASFDFLFLHKKKYLLSFPPADIIYEFILV